MKQQVTDEQKIRYYDEFRNARLAALVVMFFLGAALDGAFRVVPWPIWMVASGLAAIYGCYTLLRNVEYKKGR
jgi:hypothetical protein